jgi:hypothetical protein
MYASLLTFLLSQIEGKKTYLAALGTFGLGLYQLLVQKDVATALQSFATALGLAGLRHAITKINLSS